MTEHNYIVNPEVVLREEFDDWAILFNPENGEGFGINPVGVYIWKLLDGTRSLSDIVVSLRENCEDVPEDADTYVSEFLKELQQKHLVGVRV